MKFKIKIETRDRLDTMEFVDLQLFDNTKIIIDHCLCNTLESLKYTTKTKTTVYPALYLQNSIITYEEYE
jgi:hypothetical protein